MAFRADIIKMIEDLVTKIEDHHFKVNYSMKQDFVTFVNSFMKFHLDQTDINFTLNANLLYADTDGVKVIIATDSTMTFAVPGCTIPMRDQIEAFIVVDEVVAYDSYKMRRFRKAIQDSPVQIELLPTPPLVPVKSTSPIIPSPPNIFTNTSSSFNVQTPAASPPATTFTPPATTFTPPATTFTPPATTFTSPATTSSTPTISPTTSFNFSPSKPLTPSPSSFNFPSTNTPGPFNVQPTTTSAFHLSTIPAKPFASPTNLFSTR